MRNISLENLQEKWTTVKFRDVILSLQPGFACGKRDDRGYTQLRMNNIGLEGRVITDSFLKVPKSETNFKKYALEDGDVIFNNTNSPELVGKTVLFRDELDNCVYSNHLTRIRVNKDLTTPEFVTHFLRFEQRNGTFQLLCRRFVGQAAVPKDSLLDLDFPLLPINEQKRIVSKIEELFKESRIASHMLEKIPVVMTKFKQSILASAFRGELTSHNFRDKSTKNMIEKVKTEREKTNKKDRKIDLNESELSSIPSNWTWIPLGELLDSLQYGTSDKASATSGTGTPILRMGNIRDGKLDLTKLKYITLTKKELQKYLLQKNDILINRTNSPELVGKSAIFDLDIDFVFASYLIRLTTIKNFALPQYVNYVINSIYGRRHVERVRHQVAGQSNINSGDIREMPIPLAPLDEQRSIVNKIEESFSFADQIEKSVKEAKKRADRIDQAILAKAFRGELVPQDSNDEPASVLLERIMTQKEKQLEVKLSRKKMSKKLAQ